MQRKDNLRKSIWALTGGMGSGKSTVLQMFKRKGALTLDADQIVHEAIDHDPAIRRRIQRIFGRGILDRKNKIDKKGLAKRVFSSTMLRKRLEAILHPVVRRTMQRAISKTSAKFILCDIPLLYETKRAEAYEGVVVVNASKKNRIQRLRKKKFALKDIQARMNAQLPLSDKVKKADFVVNNNGTIRMTQKYVNTIWAALNAANS